MKEKLTLTIEKEIKKRAKHHAKTEGISVSQMVEDYLNSITAISENSFTPEPGSVTESLAGSLPLKDKRPYKEILSEALQEKYDSKKDSN